MTKTRFVARAQGFTLIEVAVATSIIGLAISALMLSVGTGTQLNDNGQKITQASFLAGEIREWASNLPFKDPDVADHANPPGPDGTNPQTFVDDVDDLMNVTYSPPRDGSGNAIANMAGWGQTITLTWRSPTNLGTTVSPGSSELVNVNVKVTYNNQEYLRTDFLVARK